MVNHIELHRVYWTIGILLSVPLGSVILLELELALKRKTGARGLRAVLENILQPFMYSMPSRGDVSECLITRDTVERGTEPLLVLKKVAKKKTA